MQKKDGQSKDTPIPKKQMTESAKMSVQRYLEDCMSALFCEDSDDDNCGQVELWTDNEFLPSGKIYKALKAELKENYKTDYYSSEED